MKKPKLMTVTWIDARWSDSKWQLDELADFKLVLTYTAGWGIEFDDRIIIITDYYPELPSQKEGCSYIHAIPKNCIKDIQYYKARSKDSK